MATSAVIHVGGYTSYDDPAADPTGENVLYIMAPTRDSLSKGLVEPVSSIKIYIKSSELTTHYDSLALASLVSYLRSNGTVSIHVVTSDGSSSTVVVDYGLIMTSFMLAGLTIESETKLVGGGGRVFTAKKMMSTDSSSSAPVRLNLGGTSSNSKTKVSLNLDDDDDMIDEDALLADTNNGMLAPPPTIDIEARAKASDDCGGRKACDNCSCGRAEMERGEEKKEQEGGVPPHKSECGNCAKGDAFRCAGCPYLGKPAFKEGEEHLVLDLTDDV
jgi:hypothetical protein